MGDAIVTSFLVLVTASLSVFCMKKRNCAPSVPPILKNKNKNQRGVSETPPKSAKSSNKEEAASPKKPFVSVGSSETFEFAADGVAKKKIPLTNLSKSKVVYKIQSPSTDSYRISPLLGILDAEGTGTLYITHNPSSEKKDEEEVDVLILNSEAPDDTDSKNLQSLVKPLETDDTTLKLKFVLK